MFHLARIHHPGMTRQPDQKTVREHTSASDLHSAEASGSGDEKARISIPVWREEAHVAKRWVDVGRGVRIHKTVSNEQHTIDLPLLREELEIETVAIGRPVEKNQVPQMRYEGETLVVPVLEEVLVVEKQLRLKEELRITRVRHQHHAPQAVALRTERITVERFDEQDSASAG